MSQINSGKHRLISLLICILTVSPPPLRAETYTVSSPDGLTVVTLEATSGSPVYTVSYDGTTLLRPSPLGLITNIGDLSMGVTITGATRDTITDNYKLDRIKTSEVAYEANEMRVSLACEKGIEYAATFRVSNNNVAFRYELPAFPDSVNGRKHSIRIMHETTGFRFPETTTTFLCPQSEAMIDWKSTKPSYEEEYTPDAPMDTPSRFGHGYTFPCLFHVGENGWVLVSETAVDSRYCASRLTDMQGDGLYNIAFPMPEENNGNGTIEPAMALPGVTPWRTITVGNTLKPIVETTIAWDNVAPLYTSEHTYTYGKGTWSWILGRDASINYDEQTAYIDLAAALGFQYVLIDNWWDTRIGRDKIESLIRYAHDKGIGVFLWYSSSGYWNDIEQGPVNRMDNPIIRKREMSWLRAQGVKGIKVDFFGGDKQETIRLYESILSDADDYGLMVIFHGCTLPRGWERMYPNYVGSEAVLASENMIFSQHFCDNEAFNACLHPFIRNTVGCMEFGGCFLNRRLNLTNDFGNIRRTTDVFELATCVLFQNPIQNFALAPGNLTDAPAWELDFLRNVPTVWDETRFIGGYPGRYVILARRHGQTWYVAGINAMKEPLRLILPLPMIAPGTTVKVFSDGRKGSETGETTIRKSGTIKVEIPTNGGLVVVADN